jgi:hypothetical protein
VIVASLRSHAIAITALSSQAGNIGDGANPTRLQRARSTAPVEVGRVAIVAGLAAEDRTVTANHSVDTRDPRGWTKPAELNRRAIRIAAVTADGIGVVARLGGIRNDAVSTNRLNDSASGRDPTVRNVLESGAVRVAGIVIAGDRRST